MEAAELFFFFQAPLAYCALDEWPCSVSDLTGIALLLDCLAVGSRRAARNPTNAMVDAYVAKTMSRREYNVAAAKAVCWKIALKARVTGWFRCHWNYCTWWRQEKGGGARV